MLVFNRSRLMILPQAISKATGLRRALAMLRLSEHNTIGIGDAENDHELLRVCELAVAVEWGSETLKAFADYVLPGSGPPAVAAYIKDLGRSEQIPMEQGQANSSPRPSRRWTSSRNRSPWPQRTHRRRFKSGKSWVTGLLCEQMILHGYSLCILDSEGDYASLDALPGIPVPASPTLSRAFTSFCKPCGRRHECGDRFVARSA